MKLLQTILVFIVLIFGSCKNKFSGTQWQGTSEGYPSSQITLNFLDNNRVAVNHIHTNTISDNFICTYKYDKTYIELKLQMINDVWTIPFHGYIKKDTIILYGFDKKVLLLTPKVTKRAHNRKQDNNSNEAINELYNNIIEDNYDPNNVGRDVNEFADNLANDEVFSDYFYDYVKKHAGYTKSKADFMVRLLGSRAVPDAKEKNLSVAIPHADGYDFVNRRGVSDIRSFKDTKSEYPNSLIVIFFVLVLIGLLIFAIVCIRKFKKPQSTDTVVEEKNC